MGKSRARHIVFAGVDCPQDCDIYQHRQDQMKPQTMFILSTVWTCLSDIPFDRYSLCLAYFLTTDKTWWSDLPALF